jgi:hypothetical protein
MVRVGCAGWFAQIRDAAVMQRVPTSDASRVKPGRQRTTLDRTEFAGLTTPPVGRLSPYAVTEPDCLHCGSSLAGRHVETRERDGGLIDVYLCPCGGGHRREVRRKP